MDNGCKFSGNREVLVEVHNVRHSLQILFIDHGIGISEEDLENIFEPFHRGSNVVHIKGHGIGLSLVERVVRLQAGTIAIKSVLNEGTTITLTFPLA
jgi:signal transduction histidine kinase